MRIHNWSKQEEKDLIAWVDEANSQGIVKLDAIRAFADDHGISFDSARNRYFKLKKLEHKAMGTPSPVPIQNPFDVLSDIMMELKERYTKLELLLSQSRHENTEYAHTVSSLTQEVEKLRKENDTLREENEQFYQAFNIARKAFTGINETAYTVDSQLNVDKK